MGGAMDLVGSGKSRVVVLMEHTAKVNLVFWILVCELQALTEVFYKS